MRPAAAAAASDLPGPKEAVNSIRVRKSKDFSSKQKTVLSTFHGKFVDIAFIYWL